MTKGFTLMEVLIAMVILSVTFLWLLSAQSQGIDMAMRSKFLTTSTMLAQERISQVVSGVLAVSVGQDQGDFRGDDDKILQAAVDYVAGLGGGTVHIMPGVYSMRNSLFER